MALNSTRIDWPVPVGQQLKTWNPITGCRRDCSYCYAKRIHDRFNKTPFSDIVVHPKRMGDLSKLKSGEIVFVGSMSDIEYWPKEQTQIIIDNCKMASKSKFMFLSKSPLSYRGYKWPENTMQGLTITKAETHTEAIKIELIIDNPHPFLSIEPLLGEVISRPYYSAMDLIIVGAMTGPGAIIPKPEWIQSIRDNIPADKIYWKKNIKNNSNK